MGTLSARRAAGALLVVVPIAFSVCFTLLQQFFEYPTILRQPTGEVLAKFVAGGVPLVAVWYVLTLTAVAFIPLVVLMHQVLAGREARVLLWVATAFGLLAGVSQSLGFLRWPFLVPHLAQSYLDPGASESQRVAAGIVFEAFHRYAGIAIGEHLGFLSTSLWTGFIAIEMIRATIVPRWMAWIGGLLALGIAAGLAEPAGWEVGAAINTFSYLGWALWLIVVGVILLIRRPALGDRPAAMLA
jgi:hypothetical protein